MKLLNALPFPLKVAISRVRLLAVITGTKYWGLDDVDKKLISVIGDRQGYFVELGANDGISQSNTKHLEMFHGWRGVLIEPYPGNFKKLFVTRSSKSHFENAACVSFEFTKGEIELTYSNLMTTPMEGSSDVVDRKLHAESGRKWLRGRETVKTFLARARTLTSILVEAKAPLVIDLLSLDVEGGEIEVLKGVDHTKFRFKWILVESRDEKRISEYLEAHGYGFHSKLTGHDYLFRNSSV
jgi:FkbM family methyltransferase